MKKLFFLSALFLSQLSFSQTVQAVATTGPDNDPAYAAFKKKALEIAPRKQSASAPAYLGYEETLKSYFIDNIIPAELPKAEQGISKKEYVNNVNQWITSNKQFLKPEHKNSLITE